ncbi:MAG: hypothetical protein ACTTJ8_10085, partial [Treponema sp.]
MNTIRKYGQSFLLGITFCLLFFVLTFPSSAQEAAGIDGKAGTAQAPDTSSDGETASQINDDLGDDEFSIDSEDDSAKPVFTLSGKIETLHGVRWNGTEKKLE